MPPVEEAQRNIEAVSTGNDIPTLPLKTMNGKTFNGHPPKGTNGATNTNWRRRSKYRHVEAYHSRVRHSSLSREPNVTASFLGFRNLMVIVLG